MLYQGNSVGVLFFVPAASDPVNNKQSYFGNDSSWSINADAEPPTSFSIYPNWIDPVSITPAALNSLLSAFTVVPMGSPHLYQGQSFGVLFHIPASAAVDGKQHYFTSAIGFQLVADAEPATHFIVGNQATSNLCSISLSALNSLLLGFQIVEL